MYNPVSARMHGLDPPQWRPMQTLLHTGKRKHKQLAGLSSEREHHTPGNAHTNKMCCWGVSELTPNVPGLDNGARYPQCTYTKAARSHADGADLETEK